MSREQAFIARLAAIASDPAARGLADDAAVLAVGAHAIVLTHDMIVEGVHYLPGDPPEDVAWKLVAVNLSDLAAKGARPLGVLLGYPLGDDAWDARFTEGLAEVLARFAVPLLGGDTVSGRGAGRMLGLTAIGAAAPGGVPSRSGARDGDALYVTGTIGLAGIGLAMARGACDGPQEALTAYRRPMPRLAEGRALAGRVSAMMDVSDGLLIDAKRMAEASGLSVTIALETVPYAGADPIAAVTAGDDYELLFAAPPDRALPPECAATRIGRFAAGAGVRLTDRGRPIPLPVRLGYEHE
ncbi:thiamine-phosphate kinase [Sphingomonas bacterium]|uniref:thiamine-phosphate kinase n=1 Tax=Sphingomonas bacterium TaxID=1895847 RepID=UPI00157571E7|nr:thiamine-phosphate kinase [Sphingomonas bacterium]